MRPQAKYMSTSAALSKDHKPNDAAERARITNAGGFVAEAQTGHYRVNGLYAFVCCCQCLCMCAYEMKLIMWHTHTRARTFTHTLLCGRLIMQYISFTDVCCKFIFHLVFKLTCISHGHVNKHRAFLKLLVHEMYLQVI